MCLRTLWLILLLLIPVTVLADQGWTPITTDEHGNWSYLPTSIGPNPDFPKYIQIVVRVSNANTLSISYALIEIQCDERQYSAADVPPFVNPTIITNSEFGISKMLKFSAPAAIPVGSIADILAIQICHQHIGPPTPIPTPPDAASNTKTPIVWYKVDADSDSTTWMAIKPNYNVTANNQKYKIIYFKQTTDRVTWYDFFIYNCKEGIVDEWDHGSEETTYSNMVRDSSTKVSPDDYFASNFARSWNDTVTSLVCTNKVN